jgi:hypothetical protein
MMALMRVLAAAMMLAVGCSGPATETCANGLVCGEGSHCDEELGSCVLDTCGDRKLDPGEDCDSQATGGATCAELGAPYHSGLPGCRPDCTYDPSPCGQCGDGIVTAGLEVCDTAAETLGFCADLGFDRGKLSCSDDCLRVTDGCAALGWRPVPISIPTPVGFGAVGQDALIVASARAVVHFRSLIPSTELTTEHTINGSVGVLTTDGGFALVVEASPGESIAHVRVPQEGGGAFWLAYPLGATDLRDAALLEENGSFVAFLVGARGVIIRLDEEGASHLNSDVDTSLAAVWADASDNVYAGGPVFLESDSGEISLLHFDGTSWTSQLTAPMTGIVFDIDATLGDPLISALVAPSQPGLYAINNGGLDDITFPGLLFPTHLRAYHASHIAVGDAALDVRLWLGNRLLSTSPRPVEFTFSDRIEMPRPWHLYANGNGTVMRFDGTVAGPVNDTVDVWSMELTPDGGAIAAGTDGVLMSHDGLDWAQLCDGPGLANCPPGVPRGLAFRDDGILRILMSNGNVHTWNGSSFSLEFSIDNCSLRWASFENELFTVGGNRICYYDGNAWTSDDDLFPGFAGVIWSGEEGVALVAGVDNQGVGPWWGRYENGSLDWQVRTGQIQALAGTASDSVYAAAVTDRFREMEILHYDGNTWTTLANLDGTPLSIDVTVGGEIFALAKQGGASTFLYYSGDAGLSFEPVRLPGLEDMGFSRALVRVTDSRIYLTATHQVGAVKTLHNTHFHRLIPWDGCRDEETGYCADEVDNDCDGYLDGNDADCN